MKELIERLKKLSGDTTPTIGNEIVFRDIFNDAIIVNPYTEFAFKKVSNWVKLNPAKFQMFNEETLLSAIELLENANKPLVKEFSDLDKQIAEVVNEVETKDEVIEVKAEVVDETKVEEVIETTQPKKRGRKANNS